MGINKKLFRKNKDKPENMNEFKPLYISMIKNICNNELIGDCRERNGKNKIRIYNLNHKNKLHHNQNQKLFLIYDVFLNNCFIYDVFKL